MKFLSQEPKFQMHRIGEFSYGFEDNCPTVLGEGKGSASLRIGKFCSIGKGVTILLGWEHRPDWVTTYPFNLAFEEFWGIQGHPQQKETWKSATTCGSA